MAILKQLAVSCLRLAVILVSFAAVAFGAAAEPRTALVIGNAAYTTAPLANPLNDARDMAGALTDSGFEVTLLTDAGQRAMDEAIRAFGARLRAAKGAGMFFFAGHGVQIGGDNYLLPVDAEIRDEQDVKDRAVNLAKVLNQMNAAGSSLNVVVLDACRNNPLASSRRSPAQGLARVQSGRGLFISYSTSPGAVALDGEGRNSPYTKHLVTSIGTAGLTLEQTFKDTLKGVYTETGGKQIPWVSSSFFGDFFFSGGPVQVAQAEEKPKQGQSAQPVLRDPVAVKSASLTPGRLDISPGPVPDLPGLYRVRGRNPGGGTYAGSVAIVGDEDSGIYRFYWWIGSDMFRGKGRLEGRWLKVDWGSSSPVVYTVAPNGVLDGLWADGSATEVLTPHAAARYRPGAPIEGRYTVRGSNNSGSGYKGTVTIKRVGRSYHVSWQIGRSRYQGSGSLEGGILIVDWGESTPVVYAVGEDGILRGLWNAGRASEVLTPR